MLCILKKIRESRQAFIKTKYEKHCFVKNQFNAKHLADFVDFCKRNPQSKIFEYLIKLFAELDLMSPIANDVNSCLFILFLFKKKCLIFTNYNRLFNETSCNWP